MAELLKNRYNQSFFDGFLKAMQKAQPNFSKETFYAFVFDKNWENKELKERMRHITYAIKEQLKGDFRNNIQVLLAAIPHLKQQGFSIDSFEFMFLPDFVEVYGLEDCNLSLKAMEEITQFVTCEFAIRPFILKYTKKTMRQMLAWSKHESLHVRRLSSEGCRPMLPWAMALPDFKKDPSPILPILENLKNDSSEYVRRSVANNLNDISKNQPDLLLDRAKKWLGKTPETDALLKHAARTLLKQGNSAAMQLFGFSSIKDIKITNFRILNPKVTLGSYLEFAFSLKNNSNKEILLRLEYGIYYQKANGALSRKVFKISEKRYEPQSISNIIRKQAFKPISTRVFTRGCIRFP